MDTVRSRADSYASGDLVTIQQSSSCPSCGAGVPGPGAACSLCGHGSAPSRGSGYAGHAAPGPPQPFGAPGYQQAPYGPSYGSPPSPPYGAPGGPGPWGQPPVQHVVHHQAEKSAGVAVLLTFLWLGAGHLYLNRVTPGVLLLVLDFFLILFFVFIPIIGWILGFLGWLAAFVAAAVSCTSIAAADNAATRRPYGW